MLVSAKFTTEDGYKLGQWISSQRDKKKKGILKQERVQRLNDSGFVWDQLQIQWEEGFLALKILTREVTALT